MPWIERGGELVLLAANGLPLPRRGERPQNASVCVCVSDDILLVIYCCTAMIADADTAAATTSSFAATAAAATTTATDDPDVHSTTVHVGGADAGSALLILSAPRLFT